MYIKKGDNVIVKTGKDRGKTGKVVRAFPASNEVIVEGVNVVKKHAKARRTNQKGQIVEKPMPINVSNVGLIHPKTGKATRVRVVSEGGKRARVAMTGETI